MIDFTNSNKLENLLASYSTHLEAKGKTRACVLSYLNANKQFIQGLKNKNIYEARQVKREHIDEFQRYLYDERDFTRSSVEGFVKHLKLFFDYLVEVNEIETNFVRDVQILPQPELPTKQLARFYTFPEILRRYLGDREKWISYDHLNNVRKHLNGFIKFLLANEVGSVYTVTESVILRYRIFLWEELVQMKEAALVAKSQVERLRCVVKLFRYLRKEGILKENPAENLGWEAYYKEIEEKAKNIPTKRPEEQRELTEFEKMRIKFLEYELGKGKSPKTIKTYKKCLQILSDFLEDKGIHNLAQVNKRMLLEYFTYICNYIGVRGAPASNGYKNHMIFSMKLFFSFLVRYEFLRTDPSLEVESLKEETGLPHTCMTEREIDKLLDEVAGSNDLFSVRDRAILEVLFSTGIRANELSSLNIDDLDFQQGLVRINNPKGGASFQRIIPIGTEAMNSVKIYLKELRPRVQNGDARALFLSYAGKRLKKEGILNIVKKYAFKCGFRKNITTHSFRVSCATLMLTNGADIRYVQEQLGHKRITSTQRYTRLVPVDLKSVHKRCHPRERKYIKLKSQ